MTPALLESLAADALPPGAALVKENPVRRTYRVRLDGVGEVFVKRSRPRRLGDVARAALRGTQGRQEHRNLVRLALAGFPVPETLGLIERPIGGLARESALVTRAVEGAARLAERLSVEAARAAGALARRLHDAGFFHRDFHAGNLLARPDGSLVLVDVQKAVRLPLVPARLRARDLAVFLHDLVERPDAAALGDALLDGYGAPAAFRARVAGAIGKRRAERLASRARRCVEPFASAFRIESRARRDASTLRIYRRRDFPAEGALAAIEAHRRAVEGGEGAPGVIKLDWPTTRVTRQSMPARDGEREAPAGEREAEAARAFVVAVKEFPERGVLPSLLNLFRRHRGMQAWRAAHALLVRGIDTPEPLALVEVRRLGVVVGSYFVTRWLEGAEDAHLYVDRRFAGGRAAAPPGQEPAAPPARARGPWGEGGERAPLGRRGEAEAVRAFARFVARLHAEGIYHGDLKLPNFLVLDGSPPRFSLLDMDAVRLGRGLTRRRRAKNLGQIEDYARHFLPQIKRTHRARFLREYGFDRSLAALAEAHVRRRAARRERVRARRAAKGQDYPVR